MSRKPCDRLQLEKSALFYADLHQEITKSINDNTLKSNGSHQKQRNNRRATQEDELVRYMSNLPGYLERGENIQEKVLNFGVLDWTRLEQWQYGNKHIPHRSSSSSSCTSNKSSSDSIEGLSAPSRIGHSSSPSHQRKCHPSLQYHFMASPMQGQSTAGKPPEISDGNCQSLGSSHGNFDVQNKLVRADKHLCQNIPNTRLKACNRKYSDPNMVKESFVLPNDQNFEARSCASLERSIPGGELKERVETLQEPNMNTIKKSVLRKSKPVILLLPGDVPQNSHPGVPDNTASLGQKSLHPSQTSSSEKSKEPFLKDPKYNTAHFCSCPFEVNCNQSLAKGSSPMDDKSTKVSPATFSPPVTAKRGITPSRYRKAEERKQTVASISSSIGPPQVSDQKVTSEKSRSSSPFRRFSISFGNPSKGSGFKEGVDTPHRRSVVDAKSGSEMLRGSAGSDVSGKDKSGNAGRSRSSPLRRLLDPLLKPKAENCRGSMESSQRDSMLINNNCRSANRKFSTPQPEKELNRDQRVGCSTVVTDSSKKHVSSSVQALLRIVVKNGLPLFTFAVDNNSDILAATVKKLSTSRKDECSCVYTFFTFRELQKKNRSWINQASKAKGSDFIHEVVAQMKVSDSHNFDFSGQDCVDSSTLKEFVLLSVKLRQGDDLATDYQPDDELAAIVVKIPKAVSFVNDVDQSSCRNDSKGLVHATVVLPSGVHSLPSKGGPSSLIERWKSGGSCDCGGWDLGCKLKILANEYKECEKSRSSEANFAEQFELFFQGNGQEHRLAVSFSSFKNGIYSVAFDPSLSLLQAFSICIALLDSKLPPQVYESRNLVEERTSGETESVHTDGIKAFSKLEDVPASYVSYPPTSPVGRV